jgi:phage N-6-adenine-methyltransferase
MSVLAKLLSHKGNQDRRTPMAIFDELNKEFNFKLDPCTSTSKPGNLNTPHYFLYPEKDGLVEDWSRYGSVFCNPPFKHALKWIKKAKEEAEKGCTVVMFLPSKTETAWWHDYALKADEIRFVRKRVIFEGHKDPFIIGMSIIIFKDNRKA